MARSKESRPQRPADQYAPDIGGAAFGSLERNRPPLLVRAWAIRLHYNQTSSSDSVDNLPSLIVIEPDLANAGNLSNGAHWHDVNDRLVP